MKYIQHTLALLTLLISTASLAQEKIFTDRPNATDAVNLIAPGTLQLELGYLNQTQDLPGITIRNITSPNIGIKYGLTDWVEMRVLTNYLTVKAEYDSAETSISGLAPITISPKFKLISQDLWIPGISFVTNITLPEPAKEEFQLERINYGFRFLLEHVFNDKYSWAHGFGADWGDERETTWAYSSAFSASLSDKVGAFAELYGYFALDFPSTHTFDAGLTYLVSNDLQLDISIGLPLNDNAPDFFFSAGLAWKTHFK